MLPGCSGQQAHCGSLGLGSGGGPPGEQWEPLQGGFSMIQVIQRILASGYDLHDMRHRHCAAVNNP